MASIPQQTIRATLTVDSGDREVELTERATVPAAVDPDVIELAVIGRLVQSAAGRYGARLNELLAPLRAAASGGDGPELNGAAAMQQALMMWRHAALALLDAYLTGQPIDFRGEPVPDAVQGRLDAAFRQRQPVQPEYRPAEQATELLPAQRDGDQTALMPQVRVFTAPGDVPSTVQGLAYADGNPPGVWFVYDPAGSEWVSVGPQANGARRPLVDLLADGDMIEVDPQTGRLPS